jgi:hypothetical protein
VPWTRSASVSRPVRPAPSSASGGLTPHSRSSRRGGLRRAVRGAGAGRQREAGGVSWTERVELALLSGTLVALGVVRPTTSRRTDVSRLAWAGIDPPRLAVTGLAICYAGSASTTVCGAPTTWRFVGPPAAMRPNGPVAERMVCCLPGRAEPGQPGRALVQGGEPGCTRSAKSPSSTFIATRRFRHYWLSLR